MSEELGWELYDIFASGIYAFPVYEHNAARRIVRYLLMRGVLDEDIANAIEGHTVDLHTWLSRAGKHMVGEWVIAWLNDRREHYKYNRHRRAQGMEETDIWERGEEEELELERQRRRRFQRRKRTKSSGQSDDEQDGGVELDESGGEDWSVESSSYRGSESSLSSISSLGSQMSFASRKFKKAALNVIPRREQSGSPCRKISSGIIRNQDDSNRASHSLLACDITETALPLLSDEISISSPGGPESPIMIRGRSLSLTTETSVQRSGSFACCKLFRKYYSLSAYDVRIRTLLSQVYRESRNVTGGKRFGDSIAPLETGELRSTLNRPNSLHFSNNLTDLLLITNKTEENSLSDSGRNSTKIPQSISGVIADAIGSSFLGIGFIGTFDKLSPDSGRASELLQDVLDEEPTPERAEELLCPMDGSVYYPAGKPCRCTLPHYISVNATSNLRSEYSANKCPVCNLGLIEKWKLFAKKKRKGSHALFCPAWKIPWTVL